MGGASSTAYSEQNAQTYLTQQFSGSCNIECQQIMSGVTIDIINTTLLGGIKLEQTCAANGQCMIGSNMDATSDILLKATNAASAEATSVWLGQIGSSNTDVESRQSIKTSIVQQNKEECNISSTQEMSDITIYAQNSTITGGIALDQEGNATGSCALGNSMTAAARAAASSDNKATAGKGANKKMSKGSKKGAKMTQLTYIVAFVVIGIVVYSIAKMMTSSTKSKAQKKAEQAALEARAQAGCPGGLEPIKDKKGKVIMDPKTRRPVCPPYVPPILQQGQLPTGTSILNVPPPGGTSSEGMSKGQPSAVSSPGQQSAASSSQTASSQNLSPNISPEGLL